MTLLATLYNNKIIDKVSANFYTQGLHEGIYITILSWIFDRLYCSQQWLAIDQSSPPRFSKEFLVDRGRSKVGIRLLTWFDIFHKLI